MRTVAADAGLRRHHHTSQHLISTCFLGVSTADPFDSLLLTSDLDAPAQPQPDLFCEFLNADPPAPPASFPSAHSAPPPACSADFLQLGEWSPLQPWADPAWLPVLRPQEDVMGWRPPQVLFSGGVEGRLWGCWRAATGERVTNQRRGAGEDFEDLLDE